MSRSRAGRALRALADDQPWPFWPGAVSALLMFLACFGPWVSADGVSVTGFRVESPTTLLFLFVLGAGCFYLYVGRGEERALWLSALAGGLGFLVAVDDLSTYHAVAGWGLWLYLLACACVVLTSLLLWRRHGRW